jgi:hypothetical protein
LYFLGEVADTAGAVALAPLVDRCVDSEIDEVARAAAWCWGMLAARYPSAPGLDPYRLTAPSRRHPVETVRFEAVVALGRAALARRSERLAQEVAYILGSDGAGRVRYGAIQSLRLLTDSGLDCRSTAVAHDNDPDFGVLFERSLMVDGSAGAGPPTATRG